MSNPESHSYGSVVREFLLHPLDRQTFDNFFRLCYSHTVGQLRYLKAKGRYLPLDDSFNGNPLGDLAMDILGRFLRSTKREYFPVIFSHFRKLNITRPDQVSPDELYRHFTRLLRSHIRQEIFRIIGERDPQTDHLKRRFKEILQGEEFTTVRSNPGDTEWVFMSRHADNLRKDKRPVSYEELLSLVDKAYRKGQTRTRWCRRIFELLNEDKDVQNLVEKGQLLWAVVTVNLKYVTEDGLIPPEIMTPDRVLDMKLAEQALEQTLAWLKETVLAAFLRKGRLTEDEAGRFLKTARWYLLDLIYCGQADSIPQYFRETMPEETHDRYLKEYKYTFETTLNKALEDFAKRYHK
jgi:hypothetical protein